MAYDVAPLPPGLTLVVNQTIIIFGLVYSTRCCVFSCFAAYLASLIDQVELSAKHTGTTNSGDSRALGRSSVALMSATHTYIVLLKASSSKGSYIPPLLARG